MLVPEADGGGSLRAGLLDLVLVAEEMGRLVAPGPARARERGGRGAGRRTARRAASAVLPGLLAGDDVAAWCGTDGRRRRPGTATSSCSTGDEPPRWRRAPRPQHLLVTRPPDDGPPSCSCRADAPGVTVTPLDGLDLVRRFAEVRFDGVAVPAAARGRRGRGAADAVERQLQVAVVLQCAETVRRDRPGLRVDPRVPRRPLLLRPAAVVVPGAQAPLRRHEDVARGVPRPGHRGGRGGRSTAPRRRRAGRAWPRPTSARTPPSSCRTACSSTAASASRGSTTSTSTCAGSRSTGPCTARPRSTASASPPDCWAAA